jgi:hypothetical protein
MLQHSDYVLLSSVSSPFFHPSSFRLSGSIISKISKEIYVKKSVGYPLHNKMGKIWYFGKSFKLKMRFFLQQLVRKDLHG